MSDEPKLLLPDDGDSPDPSRCPKCGNPTGDTEFELCEACWDEQHAARVERKKRRECGDSRCVDEEGS